MPQIGHLDMYIKKGKLCDISKFAKNWSLWMKLDM